MVNRIHILKNCSTMYRLMQTYYANKFEPFGIGAGQHYFLCEIGRRPGVTMAELAGIGAYDSGTVTRAIRRLEGNGYVETRADSRDKRVKRLYLTPRGEEMTGVVRQTRCELFKRITAGFTQEEIVQTNALLERLAQNTRAALNDEEAAQAAADRDLTPDTTTK